MTNPKCRRCANGDVAHRHHGTTTCYQYHGCRCPECKQAACRAVVDFQRRKKSDDPDWVARQRVYAKNARSRESYQAKQREWRIRNRHSIARRARNRYRSLDSNGIRHECERKRQYRLSNRSGTNEYVSRWRRSNGVAVAATEARFAAKKARIPARNRNMWTRWSADEDALACRNDMTLIEIATLLGRTYESVRTRRARLRKKELSA